MSVRIKEELIPSRPMCRDRLPPPFGNGDVNGTVVSDPLLLTGSDGWSPPGVPFCSLTIRRLFVPCVRSTLSRIKAVLSRAPP